MPVTACRYFTARPGSKRVRQAFDAHHDDADENTAAGAIIDGADPWPCVAMACPIGGDGTCYGAFNDSVVWLISATSGAEFQFKSIDASFIGAFPDLGAYPVVSGLLRVQAFRADHNHELIDLPLFGPGLDGFAYSTYSLLEPWASMNFVEIAMFGMVCEASRNCSTFDSNEGNLRSTTSYWARCRNRPAPPCLASA